MKTLIGQALGVLLILLLSYLTTAWLWWDFNPGAWSAGGRLTALGPIVFFILQPYLPYREERR